VYWLALKVAYLNRAPFFCLSNSSGRRVARACDAVTCVARTSDVRRAQSSKIASSCEIIMRFSSGKSKGKAKWLLACFHESMKTTNFNLAKSTSTMLNFISSVLGRLRSQWRSLVLILAPIVGVALSVGLGGEDWAICLGVLVVMAMWWASEALPVAVTALLPVAAFPLLGLVDTVREWLTLWP